MTFKDFNTVVLHFYDDSYVKIPSCAVERISITELRPCLEFDRSREYYEYSTCDSVYIAFNEGVKDCVLEESNEDIPVIQRIMSKKDIRAILLVFDDNCERIVPPYYPDKDGVSNRNQVATNDFYPLSINIINR